MTTASCKALRPPGDDLGSKTPAAYADADLFPFTQSWIAPDQRPDEGGLVYVAHSDDELCLYACLRDHSIYTTATKDNQPLFQLGDVAEFFIKPGLEREDYWEVHLSPNDLIMDLHFPTRGAIAAGETTWEKVVAAESHSKKEVFTSPEEGYWTAELRVPWKTFGYEAMPGKDETWQFAVSRYNYTGDLDHVEHSSIAPLTELNFHQYEHYIDLSFE
jgi:hypothetical protein